MFVRIVAHCTIVIAAGKPNKVIRWQPLAGATGLRWPDEFADDAQIASLIYVMVWRAVELGSCRSPDGAMWTFSTCCGGEPVVEIAVDEVHSRFLKAHS